MTSRTTARFRTAFGQLPAAVQGSARKMWQSQPDRLSLQFKREQAMVWFWIGSHSDYDKLLSQL